jgi:hypothetical protein
MLRSNDSLSLRHTSFDSMAADRPYIRRRLGQTKQTDSALNRQSAIAQYTLAYTDYFTRDNAQAQPIL